MEIGLEGFGLQRRSFGHRLNRMPTFLDNVEKNVIGKMYGGESQAAAPTAIEDVRVSETDHAIRHAVAYEMPVSGDLGARWEQLASERKTTTLRR